MKIFFFCLILITAPACKKEIANPIPSQPPQTFGQVFADFWNQLNVNYVYWDIDTTNWDRVYNQYKPIFAGMQLDDTADLNRSVGYFRDMTDGLVDHHFSISFTNFWLRYSSINPAVDQIEKELTSHVQYSYFLHDENYLDSGYQVGIDYTTDPSDPLQVICGTIHQNILFFTCNQFSLSSSFQSTTGNSVQPLLSYFFSRLQNPSGLKAVLLDFRDNPGGSVNDLNFLAGQFTAQQLHFGYTRYKSGNGRLDYTPWIDADVLPQPGVKTIAIPVIILADNYSASMAEITTMALHTLPQCRIVGENTFGATGPFDANILYNDGPFVVPGFLSVTTSSAEFKYIDGKIYEGHGFPPDYPVPFSAAALLSSDDPQMDKALSLVE